MKTTIYFFKKLTFGFFLIIAIVSCSKEDDGTGGDNPEATSISDYILSLSYNPDELLNVQDTGGLASERTLIFEDEIAAPPVQGTIVGCQIKDYNLESNFDDVAILRPTAGIIFPGALVVGNQGLLDGAPDPLAVERAPVSLRVDLPGIGTNGNIVVDNPQANTNVQAGLDEALEWWNDNAYQDGYVNASNSSYQAATSYSSTQLSLDIGLNAEWATGAIASQFDYESNSERRVASMSFKQVFYTVTMDTPSTPAAVFGPNVSLSQVQSLMGSSTPPAYIASVSYGRIIMVRMETTNMDSSVQLDAVLEYSSGLNSGNGEINSTYDEILQTSSISVVTIGGNAEVASNVIDSANIDDGPGGLNFVITGENALYNRNNPGVPIGYTVRYLKDNSLAKMGYNTDYRVEECGSLPFVHEEVEVFNDSFHDTRFRFRYKGQDTDIVYNSPYYELNQGDVVSRIPPSGSHDVKVIFEYQYGAGGWNFIEDYDLGYLYSDKCYELFGGNVFGAPSEVTQVTCN